MRHGEKAELERQGAKAAARGDGPQSNPLLREPNMPASTGESLHEWVSRHDAWQEGFQVQGGVRQAQTKVRR